MKLLYPDYQIMNCVQIMSPWLLNGVGGGGEPPSNQLQRNQGNGPLRALWKAELQPCKRQCKSHPLQKEINLIPTTFNLIPTTFNLIPTT